MSIYTLHSGALVHAPSLVAHAQGIVKSYPAAARRYLVAAFPNAPEAVINQTLTGVVSFHGDRVFVPV